MSLSEPPICAEEGAWSCWKLEGPALGTCLEPCRLRLAPRLPP